MMTVRAGDDDDVGDDDDDDDDDDDGDNDPYSKFLTTLEILKMVGIWDN